MGLFNILNNYNIYFLNNSYIFTHDSLRKDDFMNIDIRGHILNNFKDASIDDIRSSIVDSINDRDEVTLPGLGVFFEILWTNSSEEIKNQILDILKKGM